MASVANPFVLYNLCYDQTVTSRTGSHLLYRLIRSCLTAMTPVEIRHPEAQVSLIKNHELCLEAILQYKLTTSFLQAHYLTSASLRPFTICH